MNVIGREVEVEAEGCSISCVCYAFSWVTSQASVSFPALYKKARHVITNVR